MMNLSNRVYFRFFACKVRANSPNFSRINPLFLYAHPLSTVSAPSASITVDSELSPSIKYNERFKTGNLNRFKTSPSLRSTANLEKTLLERHSDDLEIDDFSNIFDAIDTIEWKETLSKDSLDAIIRLINVSNFDAATLSDRQLAVLFKACGSKCTSLPPKRRDEHMNQILRILKAKGAKLQEAAINAVIAIRINNGLNLDFAGTLKKLSKAQVALDIDTCVAFVEACAMRGDVGGIIEILTHLKESGQYINEKMTEAFVYALSLSGQIEKALLIAKSYSSSDRSFEKRLRLSFASARAEKGDIDGVIKAFEEFEELPMRGRYFANRTLDIFLKLLSKNCSDSYEKLLPLLEVDANGKLSNIYDSSLVNEWVYQWWMSSEMNTTNFTRLFTLMPDRLIQFERRRFRSHFFQRLSQDMPIPKLLDVGGTVEKIGLMKNPFCHLIDLVLVKNRSRFLDTYKAFLSSNELERFHGRPQIHFPFMANCLSKVQKAKTPAEKIDIFAQSCVALSKCGIIPDYLAFTWIVDPILKDEQCIADLVRKLSKDENALNRIGSLIVIRCCKTKNWKLLTNHFDDCFKHLHFGYGIVKNYLLDVFTKANSSEDELSSASDLLLRILHGVSERHSLSDRAVQIILHIIKAVNLERAKSLMEIWCKDNRFVFSSLKIEKMREELFAKGEKEKASLLSSIKKSPSARLRWQKTVDIEKLEKEAVALSSIDGSRRKEVLAALYSIILEKKLLTTPTDLLSITGTIKKRLEVSLENERVPVSILKTMENTIKSAIKNNDFVVSKLLWETGSAFLPPYVGISYALLLFKNNLQEEAKAVLTKTSSSKNILIGKDVLQTFTQFSDISTLNRFFNLMTETFSLTVGLKKRLKNQMNQIILNDLINSGKIDAAFAFARERSADNHQAFGQFQLMEAAIDNNQIEVLRNVVLMVQKINGKDTALINLGVLLLEKEKDEHAERIFSMPDLHCTSKMLVHLVNRELSSNRPDVLVKLFRNLNGKSIVTTADLNMLLNRLVFAAETRSSEAIRRAVVELNEEIRNSSFPLSPKLSIRIEKVISVMKVKTFTDFHKAAERISVQT